MKVHKSSRQRVSSFHGVQRQIQELLPAVYVFGIVCPGGFLGKLQPLIKFCLGHVMDIHAGFGIGGDQFFDQGFKVFTLNWGIMGSTTLFPVDMENERVAEAGGTSLKILREKQDQDFAINVMNRGIKIIRRFL